jgi:hypothetical protein
LPPKLIRIQGRTFVKGKYQCTDCGKKMKYCLEQSLALAMVAATDLMLCRGCYWEDKDVSLAINYIISEVI